MDGYVQGLHRSPHLGFALDFAQHRQYTFGDDIKRIDWRVYAKADRYYIKQYEVSTTLAAHLIVDASGSMGYKGEKSALSKFRYAQFIAASLAYLALHQQDAAGLVTFDSAVRDMLPARSAPSHLLQIVRTLEATAPTKESGIAPLLHQIADRIKRRSLVIIISDLLDNAKAVIQALHHLRFKRHEVLLLHVMDNDELTFPFRSWSLFENLERSDHRMRLDPAMIRAQYMQNLDAHLGAIRDGVAKLSIQHVLLNTDQPFDDALVAYLARSMGKK
jgi:uncharacterized protein (DUF58 family)